MEFNIDFNEMARLEPATDNLDNLKARYTLAKRIYRENNLGKAAQIILNYIDKKLLEQASSELFNDTLRLIKETIGNDDSINAQGTLGMMIADLNSIK